MRGAGNDPPDGVGDVLGPERVRVFVERIEARFVALETDIGKFGFEQTGSTSVTRTPGPVQVATQARENWSTKPLLAPYTLLPG